MMAETSDSAIIVADLIEDWTATGARHADIARQAPWRQGDWLVERLGGGKLDGALRDKAVRVTGREAIELTRLIAVCRAFPPDRRRADLTIDHHEAILKLEGDTERDAMLAMAAAEGWTARQTRRQVLNSRVARGAFVPNVDDDPDDTLYRSIAQAWNRASRTAREAFLQSAEEAEFREIVL